MILIVCVDDRMGMFFNGRRQSRDRAVLGRILERTAGGRLWVSGYTARLFAEMECPQLAVEESFLDRAEAGEYCFVEDKAAELPAQQEQIEKIIVYRWNRSYPADVHLGLDLEEGWKLEQGSSFPGYSHDEITEEIYTR